MQNEARLKQLIEETKTKRLGEFRSSLEHAISNELCDILEISYSITKPEERPKATFGMNKETWEIWLQVNGPARWLLIRSDGGQGQSPSGPVGFNTKDDLLLLIDKSIS